MPGNVSGRSGARERLFAPVDIASLVYFRIAFGGLMLWGLLDLAFSGGIRAFYIAPQVHFTYDGFEWVRPWPAAGMYLHAAALIALALCIALGLFYRAATILFCAGYTYLFLLDAMYYLNHEYLICLVSGILIFLPANRAGSLDVLLQPERRSDTTPAWTLWLLRAQFAIPYFYGGLAKLNQDWLSGVPVRLGLGERADFPLIGFWLGEERTIDLFVWGGLLFDLLIIPLLLFRPTRAAAFACAVLFHLINAAVFHIGVFPWLMIAGTALFFPPDWPRRLLRLPEPKQTSEASALMPGGTCVRLTLVLLAGYLAAQLLVPLRHHLYPGDASWTEEGHRFAWRMMLNHKRGLVRFYATNPQTGETWPIDHRPLLTRWQGSRLPLDPDLIQQFAHHLARELVAAGFGRHEIHAVVLVSLNGRKPQLLIDPNVDLAAQPRTIAAKPWVVPLSEPMPAQPWTVPLSRWTESIEIDWRPKISSRPPSRGAGYRQDPRS